MKRSVKPTRLLLILIVILTLFTSGCTRIIGEVKVDWRANVTVGLKMMMSSGIHQLIGPIVEKQSKRLDEMGIHEIKENEQRGYKWQAPLEEVQTQFEKLRSILPLKKNMIDLHIKNYWLFKAIDINANIDVRDVHIPQFASFLLKPSFELTLPIYTKNNADVKQGNKLIWKLSLQKPNSIWIHVWVPNVVNDLIVMVVLLIDISVWIVYVKKKKSRKK